MSHLKTSIISLAALFLATACGEETTNQNQNTKDHVVSERASSNHGEYNHARRMYPMRYSYVDSRGYGYYAFVHINIRDTAYVDALKTRAEAALVRARTAALASAARTAAIWRKIYQIESEVGQMNTLLAADSKQQSLIMHHAKTLSKIADEGNVSKPVLASVKFFLNLADISVSTLSETSVDTFSEDQFTARGEYRVVDGRIYKNVDPVSFEGSNLLEYITFLNDNHQNPKVGSAAHRVLLKLFDEVKLAGAKRLERLEESKEARRQESREAFKGLEELIAEFK
jgi:hypothetical protein